MTHENWDTRHKDTRPTTPAGRFCRTCSNSWSSKPCVRSCRKSGTRGDEFGLPWSIHFCILSCESVRSIMRRCILHSHVPEQGATVTNLHETDLPQSFQRFVPNLASKLEKLLHEEWIWGCVKEDRVPFLIACKKVQLCYPLRFYSTFSWGTTLYIQVVNALNEVRPDELFFKRQFASNSTLAVPLECIQPCCLEACGR